MTVGSSAALGIPGVVAGSAPSVGTGSRDEGILHEKAFLHFISSIPVTSSPVFYGTLTRCFHGYSLLEARRDGWVCTHRQSLGGQSKGIGYNPGKMMTTWTQRK